MEEDYSDPAEDEHARLRSSTGGPTVRRSCCPCSCCGGALLLFPRGRGNMISVARLADGFVTLARRAGGADAVSGTATAGIPHATLLADRLDLPLSYVRSQAKAHGKGNQIEGRVTDGQRVLVVEDLVSTGGSVIAAVEALRDAGALVQTVLAVFTYGLDAAADAVSDAGFTLRTLTDFPALLEVAREDGLLDDTAIQTLEDWRRDPEGWSQSRGGA